MRAIQHALESSVIVVHAQPARGQRVYAAGGRGLTAKEATAYVALTDVQINRRLSSMGERKLITRTKIGNTAGGRTVYEQRGGCCVWRVTHG